MPATGDPPKSRKRILRLNLPPANCPLPDFSPLSRFVERRFGIFGRVASIMTSAGPLDEVVRLK